MAPRSGRTNSTPEPNAIVEYVDERTGGIIAVEEFVDPGLDEKSWYARDLKARGKWRGLHMAYSCGRPK